MKLKTSRAADTSVNRYLQQMFKSILFRLSPRYEHGGRAKSDVGIKLASFNIRVSFTPWFVLNTFSCKGEELRHELLTENLHSIPEKPATHTWHTPRRLDTYFYQVYRLNYLSIIHQHSHRGVRQARPASKSSQSRSPVWGSICNQAFRWTEKK
jgi:hypothetical protein